MPVIPASDAPHFSLPDAPQTSFTGLAAASRGARETSVWRLSLGARSPAAPHVLDHEEILVGLRGQALARIASEEFVVGPGDTVIVPAGLTFSLANPHPDPFEAVAVLPVGARASLASGQWFVPPWTA